MSGFSKSTIHDAVKRKHTKSQGGQTVLSTGRVMHCGEISHSLWGFPLDIFEFRVLVKMYLDRQGMSVRRLTPRRRGAYFTHLPVERGFSAIP